MTEGGGGTGLSSLDLVGAFTTATADVMQLFAQLLPIALGIFAATWGVRKAMKFFKGTTA